MKWDTRNRQSRANSKQVVQATPKATDQALKLLQMMSNLSEQAALNDDGTTPDMAADLEAIEQLLALHDVTVTSTVDEDENDAGP